jgi:predicted nuclease with TOPRIM domain
MTDETANLVLEHLRHIRASIDRLADEVHDLKGRVTGVESGLIGVRRDIVTLAEANARLQVTVDCQSDRLERIEKRFDLAEA